MRMIDWLNRWMTRKLREADREQLWPQLVEESRNRALAERAFRTHMDIDPAYHGLTAEQKQAFLEQLP